MTRLRGLVLSRWGVLFALAGAAGIALRAWTYHSHVGVLNSDEAVVGLMVRHALEGELTTFYWGQAYGGTQEVLLSAPVFLIAGTSVLALRIVPIVLTAVAALLVWRVGRRTIGEPGAAVAAALFWVWPPIAVLFLTRQQGFYASNVVYCALLLLLALRVVERPDRVRTGVFGLVLGLALWQTPHIVPVAVGIVAWTIWKQPGCLRHLWVAALLAALGALPAIVWNAGNDWESLSRNGPIEYARSLRFFAPSLLAMTIGLRTPFTTEALMPLPLIYLAYLILLGLLFYGAFKARRRNASILYAVAAVFPFVYALSHKTAFLHPRFIVVLTPVLALLFAQLARGYRSAAALLVAACLVSAVHLHRMDTFFQGYTEVLTSPRDLGPLISTLDGLGLDRVYAEYWIAYRLTFDTRERIIAVENAFKEVSFEGGQAVPRPDPPPRYPPYEREVRAARHGFVFFRETTPPIPIIPQLERSGYRPNFVGPFVVYAPPVKSR